MSRNGVCFVISPIGDADVEARGDAKDVMDRLIGPALAFVKERTGIELQASRSDQRSVVGEIVDNIILRILQDDVVIAVLFNRNPNVYYELGIAHTAARPVDRRRNGERRRKRGVKASLYDR